MKHRRGFSLVELLVVLAVGTALLGVAMSVLYLLKETQVNARRRLNQDRMVTRLADCFREDVHAANEIMPLPDPVAPPVHASWQLAAGSGVTVRYDITSHAVRRVRTAGNEVVQDDYRLPEGMGATIHPPEAGSPLTRLHLEPTATTSAGPRSIHIEAVLGLDHRHSTSSR